MDRKSEIQLEIHRLLIELCSIADDNNQVLETDISTVYMCPTGNVGVNAVLGCKFTLIDKDKL